MLLGMSELPEDASPLAREVHRRMRLMHLNPKSLAKKAGVGESYVRDLMRGKSKNPRHDLLQKLAQALCCSILDLINPGGAQKQPSDSEIVDQPDELALLRFYRLLSFEGKKAALQGMFDAAGKLAVSSIPENGR